MIVYLVYFGLGFAIVICSTFFFFTLWPIIEKPWAISRSKKKSQNPRAAIVVVPTYPKDKWYLYSQGLIWLGFWLDRIGISYNLIRGPTIQVFQGIIENDSIECLFVFGHGKRYGLRFGDTFLEYSKLKKGGRKKFVGQYHCNIGDHFFGFIHGKEITLADVTKAELWDINSWMRFSFVNNIKFFLWFLFKKKLF